MKEDCVTYRFAVGEDTETVDGLDVRRSDVAVKVFV